MAYPQQTIRHNWTKEEIITIYNQPIMDLIYQAASIHRQYHDPNSIQISSLLSIKTGGCSEDCAYCPQSARYQTGIKIEKNMMSVSQVKEQAVQAKLAGVSRVCMGAAWRNVKEDEEFEEVLEMVRTINKLDMEVCCTLGMITENQAKRLAEAGLYAYNHNLDTSEEYYQSIISTRSYQDRIKTIENIRKTNITVCSGGIIGMGESLEDRAGLLIALSTLDPQPESVPINSLVPVEGTPLEHMQPVETWEMVRMVATTRIVMPQTQVRLSAGRVKISPEGQALCFLAGANSIFAGDKLLTTPNPNINEDMIMLAQLGMRAQKPFETHPQPQTIEAHESQIMPNTEKIRWSRPKFKIALNEEKRIKNKRTNE